MSLYAFVVAIPGGDDQEYRVNGPQLTAEEAVERCYGKYPEGRITRVLNGDTEGVDLSNPNLAEDTTEAEADEVEGEDTEGDDGDSIEGVTPPFDPADYTLAELEDKVRGHSDEELAAVLDAEMEDKDRTGAKDILYNEMSGYQP